MKSKSYDFINIKKDKSHLTGSFSLLNKISMDDISDKSSDHNTSENTVSKKKSTKKCIKKWKAHLDLQNADQQNKSSNDNLGGSFLDRNFSKITSTPNASSKSDGNNHTIKSIMRNKVEQMNLSNERESPMENKRKQKRSKSVSFVLDENEKVLEKKPKSDESVLKDKNNENNKKQDYLVCKDNNTNPKIIKTSMKKNKEVIADIENNQISINKKQSNGDTEFVNEESYNMKTKNMKKLPKKTLSQTTDSEKNKTDKESPHKSMKEDKLKLKGKKKYELHSTPNKLNDSQIINGGNEYENNSERKKKIKHKNKTETVPKTFCDTDGTTPRENQVIKESKKKIQMISESDTNSQGPLNIGNTNVTNATEVICKGQNKEKKNKRSKKHKVIETVETEGEPGAKTIKKDIVDDLQNLTIGVNTQTLVDLLDDMTVVDKNKKNKKPKKLKPKKALSENSEEPQLESIEEAKEKVKWTKRKWNKDKKGEVTDEGLLTSVIVEKLPLKIMSTYKKILTDHFTKFGEIKKIGFVNFLLINPHIFICSNRKYNENNYYQYLSNLNNVSTNILKFYAVWYGFIL